jgi:hypothetical protein
VQNAHRGSRRGGATRKPDFPDCEDELYVRFLFRRLALGYPCNHFWLISEFKKILVEASPPEYKGKKYSKGWVVRFCVRYRITTQAKNNIKEVDQVDRAKAITGKKNPLKRLK